MTASKDDTRKKARVTSEDLTEIKRLYRQGMSISDIARNRGFHRHTIRTHLQEKKEDIVAEAARTQVLAEAVRDHFRQNKIYAQNDFKLRLDASVPGAQKPKRPRVPGPIVIAGILALPYTGGANYMAEEWARMYDPSPKDDHHLKSLRAHTEDSTLWVHWDSWRRKVSAYENASKKLWTWLRERLEEDLFDKVDPLKIEPMARWLFGNFLIIASDGNPDDLDIFRRIVFDPENMIIGRDPNTDADGSRGSFDYLSDIRREAEGKPEWEELQLATAALKSKDNQLELRRIAREIDVAVSGLELMAAFPGHCPLCPV